MNRFKCPACGGNQYTSCSTAQGCIYCGNAAIRAESGEPIPEVGTHVDPEVAKQRLAEYAGKMGWMPYK